MRLVASACVPQSVPLGPEGAYALDLLREASKAPDPAPFLTGAVALLEGLGTEAEAPLALVRQALEGGPLEALLAGAVALLRQGSNREPGDAQVG